MRRLVLREAVLLVTSSFLVLLTACSLGKQNILFLTKTSLGVDIDTKPPTLDIGYSRKEGTLAPKFEQGDVLPQMASFSSNVGLMNTAIGQSFAVGSAALIMSKYLGTLAEPDVPRHIPNAEIMADSSKVPGSLSKARRYFFGTDTSFAVRITFGLETGGYPDSLNVGYKRKELAYVPITQTGTGDQLKVSVPSLLATAGLDAEISTIRETEVRYTQFYATGLAASYLAAKPEIRNTVALKILSDEELRAKLTAPALQRALEEQRTKEFVEAGRQKRVERLLDEIDRISQEKAKEINDQPPVKDPAADSAIENAGGKNAPKEKAKQMLKMRVVLGKRSDAYLDAWEAAIRAAQQ